MLYATDGVVSIWSITSIPKRIQRHSRGFAAREDDDAGRAAGDERQFVVKRHGVDVDAALLDLRRGAPTEVAHASLDVLHVNAMVNGKQPKPAMER
jgi:hypothetical protein